MTNMQPYPDATKAACAEVGVEFFYTEDEDIRTGKASRKYIDEGAAKRICADCPIREECLNWGMHHERWGIWGGLNPQERHYLRIKTGITVVDPVANNAGYYDARV
jgi:hypothetical protein